MVNTDRRAYEKAECELKIRNIWSKKTFAVNRIILEK